MDHWTFVMLFLHAHFPSGSGFENNDDFRKILVGYKCHHDPSMIACCLSFLRTQNLQHCRFKRLFRRLQDIAYQNRVGIGHAKTRIGAKVQAILLQL